MPCFCKVLLSLIRNISVRKADKISCGHADYTVVGRNCLSDDDTCYRAKLSREAIRKYVCRVGWKL